MDSYTKDNIQRLIKSRNTTIELLELCNTVAPHIQSIMEYNEDNVAEWSAISKLCQNVARNAQAHIESYRLQDEFAFELLFDDFVYANIDALIDMTPYNYVLYPSSYTDITEEEVNDTADMLEYDYMSFYENYKSIFVHYNLRELYDNS